MQTERVPLYPKIKVRLIGEDGNAFAILGRVRRAMTQAGCNEKEVKNFIQEATSGDYDHLLETVVKTVTTD